MYTLTIRNEVPEPLTAAERRHLMVVHQRSLVNAASFKARAIAARRARSPEGV